MKKLIVLCLLAIAASLFAVRGEAQILIIANRSVKADATTKGELRDVFTGEAQSLRDGSRVVPVFLQSGPAHEEFLSNYVRMPDSMVRVCWRKLTFSGQSSMPKFLDSEIAVVAYVATTPGAIGYISKATQHDGVKVLAVK